MKQSSLKVFLSTLTHLMRFLPYYLREMTLSNLRIAQDAFRAKPHFTPGFIDLDLSGYTPVQRWAAASLISMTPGTLSVDLSENPSLLHVHALYLENEQDEISHLNRLIRKALGEPSTGGHA